MIGNGQKKDIKKTGIIVLLLACSLCGAVQLFKEETKHQQISAVNSGFLTAFLTEQMEKAFFVLPMYLNDNEAKYNRETDFEQLLISQFPFYQYTILMQAEKLENEDEYMARVIRQEEGADEDVKNIEEGSLDYTEDAIHIENSMLQEMQKENSLHNNEAEGMKQENENESLHESEASLGKGEFIASGHPAYTYDWSEEWNYENLVSNFYAVDQSTWLDEEYLDLDKLLEEDLSVDKTIEGPQILIYHTHSREDFADSVQGDYKTTIVGAGERLASLLQTEYGFRVLHHQAEYDTERLEAYSVALPEIEKLLKQNPTIEVVIDLHRDEMTGDRRLVMDLQGRPTARFMFFNGLSYSKKNGPISYLENPYIQENLALSFQAQVAANEYYPGIARKVYLKAYRYNMHLKPKSMLIELGAQNNTVEEIMNACDPLAHILAIVLDEML